MNMYIVIRAWDVAYYHFTNGSSKKIVTVFVSSLLANLHCLHSFSGEPLEHYDCNNDDTTRIQYQLLQYSEQDQYTIPCTIKPGRLRDRYSISWFSRGTGIFESLTTVDTSSFDLRTNSTMLLHDERWLACRVDIRHDGDNTRQYCGRRMRAAGNVYWEWLVCDTFQSGILM